MHDAADMVCGVNSQVNCRGKQHDLSSEQLNPGRLLHLRTPCRAGGGGGGGGGGEGVHPV